MINIKNDPRNTRLEQQNKYYRKMRISLAILTVVICSLNIRSTTIQTLKHSRSMYRTLNKELLLHDQLDIYWFGFRAGQYLINYPIHQYYFVGEFSEFLQRIQNVMGNLQYLSFGLFNQQKLNKTNQKITIQNNEGTYQQYQWTIQEGFLQPFTSNNTAQIKQVLLRSKILEIGITKIQVSKSDQNNQNLQEWEVSLVVQPFSQTSIIVTLFLQQKLYLGFQHISHLLLALGTIYLFLSQVQQRIKIKGKNKKIIKYGFIDQIGLTDIPDGLVIFFLLFSSFVSLVNLYTVRYILLLDGVTCLITWLYILKLYSEKDDYHVSFLIKKSYILVGRLFVSFGPMFIGFCLFALTVFCRYTDLFVSFHKTFISLFCVCYYNMTYQQYRTTQRSNPISAIFFTTLVMLFTACIYSGMLVSVFCSYMWNKRENKNKQQLLNSLKIECLNCNTKYSYSEGYQQSLQKSIHKKESQLLQNQDDNQHKIQVKYRNALNYKLKFLHNKFIEILNQNQKYIQVCQQEEPETASQYEKQYGKFLISCYKKSQLLIQQIQQLDIE